MDLEPILKGVVPSIGAALLLVSLAGTRYAGVAMAIGVFVAFGLLKQWPAWPHELWRQPNGTQWLVWSLVFAGIVAAIEPSRLVPAKLRPMLGPLIAAIALWLMLQKVATRWSFGEVLLYIGGGATAVAAIVAAHRAVLLRAPLGIAPAVLFTLVLSVDAMVLVQGSSGLYGQLSGAVAAALGATAGTRLWRRPFVLGEAHAAWIGLAHGLFLLAAVHMAYLSWSGAGCAFVAPCLPLLLRDRLRSRPFVWMALAELLVMLPLSAALLLA